jgi:PAS domain-containing protein
MVTASQDGDDGREALTRGANDSITKPVDFFAIGRIATQLSMKNAAVWDWSLQTEEMHASPRWMDMLGFDHDQTCWTAQEWLARVHPDDIGRLKSAVAAHMQGETPYFEIEHRVQRSNGTWRSIVTRGLGVREDGGPIGRIVGWSTAVSGPCLLEAPGATPPRLLRDRLREVLGRSATRMLAGARG